MGQLLGDAHNVVFADGDDLYGRDVLVVLGVAVGVVGNELLRVLSSDGNRAGKELNKLSRRRARTKEEVEAFAVGLDAAALSRDVVLDQELLHVEKRLLVRSLLANLDL